MLECLPRLNKFCSSKCVLKFPLLEEVAVKECPRMNIFSEGNTSAPNLRKVKIEEDYEKWRWNGNLNDTVKNMFEDKVAFCDFKSLTLSDYPELKDLWYGAKPHDKVFCNLKSLVVQRCDFLSDVLFPSNMLQVLHGLEEVEVRDCDSLEAVFDVKGMKSKEIIEVKQSSCLKRLTLSGLPKLKQIWNDDPYDIISFENLCTVDVSECQTLLYIFPLSICEDLGQLEKLEIESCGVEEIVATMEERSRTTNIFKFPQLSFVRLWSLTKLKSFYPEKHTLECPSLKTLDILSCEALRMFSFNHFDLQQPDSTNGSHDGQALFSFEMLSPNLEQLTVWNCPSLMSLVPSSTSFTNLTELEVGDCNKLVYLITSSTAKSLVQLKTLKIKYCEMMLDVVKIEEQEVYEEDIIFQNLEYLKLISMSSLRSFCYGKHTFMFPSLTYLHVKECPQIEIFSSGVTIAPYLTSIQVENKKKRWKGDINTTIQQLFIEKKEVSHPDDK